MPIRIPNLSDQKYQDLVDEALARVPVHNPEWTNFNDSDPGVTLLQLFAFLTENLLYRANQIPERNRRKFLKLLGIPLQPATPARGIVSFANDKADMRTVTLPAGMELRAGQIPFRTEAGLDVLPLEWLVVYKRRLESGTQELLDLYRDLYVSYSKPGATPNFSLYETVPLKAPGPSTPNAAVNLSADTIDGCLWIALMRRTVDRDRSMDEVREAIAGKTLSLGMVPNLAQARPVLAAGASRGRPAGQEALLAFEMPAGAKLGDNTDRMPRYRPLESRSTVDLFSEPGIVQITLPGAKELVQWDDVEPLERGVGDMPPSLEDTVLEGRLVTWLRLRLASKSTPAGQAALSLVWVGPNAAMVCQRAHVTGEALPQGTGAPDQVVTLSRTPVVPKSVQLIVAAGNSIERWSEIDDLSNAGSEVRVLDPSLPPGGTPPRELPTRVFTVNAESGEITFGDGVRGARPPFDARIRVDYDYSSGRAGNVGPGGINTGPGLPPGFKVTNDLRTWGGADAETPEEGERHISQYLQHRDRLVTAADFHTIARRTPGVEIGRIEVIPAFKPDPSPGGTPDAAGAVTLMVLPRYDPAQPDAPQPDRLFLNTICSYLDPRRLVTTEVHLRGPDYKKIWISVGIQVAPGWIVATVREDVKQTIQRFLAPLPPEENGAVTSATITGTGLDSPLPTGWPLSSPVIALQLWAVAARVPGVLLVKGVLLAQDGPASTPLASEPQVDMVGLQLPRIAGLSVALGDPMALDDLRKQTAGIPTPSPEVPPGQPTPPLPAPLPVPVIPQECQECP